MDLNYLKKNVEQLFNEVKIEDSLSNLILNDTLKEKVNNYEEIIKNLEILFKLNESLNVNNDPELYFKCRNIEEIKISNFITLLLKGVKPKNTTLILYGQPGIGKTHLISKLKEELENKKLDIIKIPEEYINEINNIKVIFLNAISFESTIKFMNTIIEWIFSKSDYLSELLINDPTNWDSKLYTIKEKLKDILKTNKYIILIDELDFLKKQDSSRFNIIVDFLNIDLNGIIKIGISNTFDLFGGLKCRIKNKLEFTNINFKSYDDIKMKNILFKKFNFVFKEDNNELLIEKINNLIEPKVFEMITKKISKKGSSDFRRVLSITKEVFLRYLKDILNKRIEKNADNLENIEIKIKINYAFNVINEYLKDKRPDIFLKLSIFTKYYLLAIYLNYDIENFIININKVNESFKEINKENINENSNIDINNTLKNLVDYNFIEKINGKNVYELKINYIDLKHILSNYEYFMDYFN